MIIYKIENKYNGKIYIGKTAYELSRRISAHIRNKNSVIGMALKKYGIDAFSIKIIDYADSKDILSEKEKYWILKHHSKSPNGYNLTDGGEGVTGSSFETREKISIGMRGNKNGIGTKWPEEKRRKVSLAMMEKNKGKTTSQETKIKISAALKGRIKSEEERKKLSIANTGKHHTPEARLKISNARKGSKASIETRGKLSIALMGHHNNDGRKLSEETKNKIRLAKTGKPRSNADRIALVSQVVNG